MKPNIFKLHHVLSISKVPLKIESLDLKFRDLSVEFQTIFLAPLIDLNIVPIIKESEPNIGRMLKVYQILNAIKTENLFRVCIIGEFSNFDTIEQLHPYEDEYIHNVMLINEAYFSVRGIDIDRFHNEFANHKNDIIIFSSRNFGYARQNMSMETGANITIAHENSIEVFNQLPETMDYMGINLLTSIIGSLEILPSEYDIVRAINAYHLNDLKLNIKLLISHNKPFVQKMVNDMLSCTNMYKAQSLILRVKRQLENTSWESLIESNI
jgi:hypothetical protein